MNALITVFVIIFVPVWAFWGPINAWFQSKPYHEYIDDEILRLREQPEISRHVPKWVSYTGFALSCIGLILASPESPFYWPCIIIAGIAFLGNAWAILR